MEGQNIGESALRNQVRFGNGNIGGRSTVIRRKYFGTALFPRRLKMAVKKKPAKMAKKVKICPTCKKAMSKCDCK
jgi:hypothetical protein